MSLWWRISNVLRGERVSREIDEELQAHLSDAIEEGRDPVEARHALGSRLRLGEESREIRIASRLDSLRADAVFGWRQLLKRKAVSAAAVLSLALAIGACVAAFRLIDAMLWRPLPIAHPERLYVMAQEGLGPAGTWRVSESCEYPLFRRLRATVKDQAEMIAIGYAARADVTYGSDDEMEKVWREYVSGWMFSSFGLTPAAGRFFTENDDQVPGASPLVVLSYDYWTRRFGRNPGVIGRTVRIEGALYEITGVAPRGFTGAEPGLGMDIFVPAMMNPYVTRDDSSWFRAFVQLKPGVVVQPVLDRLRGPFQANQEERAKGFKGRSRTVIQNFLRQKLILEPAGSGVSDMRKDYRTALIALGVLVVLVLLIACANVANLMTAQASARAREMALRVSIGAGRWRLVQLVLVESAMIAFFAALAGGSFASWAAPFVASRVRPADDPAHIYLPADWRVLAFALGLTLLVACLFGLLPALRASSVQPIHALKGGDSPHARRRMMQILIAAQVAFCFVVLFVAGLFAASSGRLAHQPTGFSSGRLLAVDVTSAHSQKQFAWERVAESLRATPGVERVAISSWPLLSGNGSNGFIMRNGAPVNDTLAYFLGVSPGWMETMKIPILDGRDFRPGENYPDVAIVNESFAKAYFHGEDPVGKWFERPKERFQIVGLVRDARYRYVREPMTPTAFVPLARADGTPLWPGESFLVRTVAANPMALASTLRRAVPQARADFRVSSVRTQQELVDQHTVRERLMGMLGLFFAGVALLLAGVGLYGVLDYSVAERRREIGIRMAIGARAGVIALGVSADALRMVLAGAAAGVALGLTAARSIASLLFQVKPTDVSMLVAPAFLILAASFLAALPAVVRAVRIDPASTLRSE